MIKSLLNLKKDIILYLFFFRKAKNFDVIVQTKMLQLPVRKYDIRTYYSLLGVVVMYLLEIRRKSVRSAFASS